MRRRTPPALEKPITTLAEAVAFLLELVREDPRPYQARAALAQHPVRALLRVLDDPQTGLPAVHVAGSKGKGSTVLILEALLERAGVRTGAYTSPHLQRWTERIRLRGRDIEPTRFAALIERLRPSVAALLDADAASAPSFFDVLTAAALAAFRDAAVDCAIVETGIGGRLDATNVLGPLATCITSVELEHSDKLGARLADIAAEKVGIARPGVPLVTGALPAEAMRVVVAHARDAGVPLWRMGEEIHVSTRGAASGETLLDVTAPGIALSVPVRPATPSCMLGNTALALVLASLTRLVPPADLGDAARAVLPGLRLPGRLEIVREHPFIVVDGAHTLSSMHALVALLDSLPAGDARAVVSVTRGKDPARLLAPLAGRIARLWVTAADRERSIPAQALAEALRAAGFDHRAMRVEPDPNAALAAAAADLGGASLLCVTGSMYMAGLAREHLLAAPRGTEPA